MLIVVASYIFYGWWDWRFLFLIVLTSLFSYSSGILMNFFDEARKRKIVNLLNIIVNIGILAIFKYYNFFVQNLIYLLDNLGYQLDYVSINVILPVGISFYTFQALSYSIDVYRRKIKATTDIVEFFAFISFFPQLVAGPIERATNLLPQFQKRRIFNYEQAVDGMRQMLWGFFKKVVVADNCAFYVNRYWDLYADFSGVSLLALAIMFSIQIYCDFSGYSDIAIGCARLFGFNLKRNFEFPYFSRSIPDFWRRWHISLMTWFRDYVYFPLGGNKCSKLKYFRNILIVWCISGLWHGANWTFIFWGVYHACLLVIYSVIGVKAKYDYKSTSKKILPEIMELFQMILTFFLAVLGWILFRSKDLLQASQFICHMFDSLFVNFEISFEKSALYTGFLLLFVEWIQRGKQHALQFSRSFPFNQRLVRWSLYVVIIVLIFCFRGQNQTFIYFQF